VGFSIRVSLRLGAAAFLFGAVAAVAALGQRSGQAKFRVIDSGDGASVVKPQYRLRAAKGTTTVTIHAGEKPTGGWEVSVKRVERVSGACVVHYRVQGPPPDAIVTQALNYPFTTVRITPTCREVRVEPPLPRGPLR
jgi:hypothetical protein